MMKRKIAAVAAAALLTVLVGSGPAVAADDHKELFIYASYFHCSSSQQADEAVGKLYKGVYDAAVKDGTIGGWAWLAHNTGGDWTRLVYHSSSSLEGLFSAAKVLDERTGGKANEAVNKQFGQACHSHEDYVWHAVAGNEGGTRGKVGFSVYHVCDMSREAQADELVKRVFVPVYDQLVADGKLTSWGWAEHIIGGKYRRLETMTAADLGSLMAARSALIEKLSKDPLGEVLNDICGSHSDYIWEMKEMMP